MENLIITEREGANYKLYELTGGLNAYTLGDFAEKLYASVLDRNVVLDMSKLIEIDSSGLGLVMAAFNDAVDAEHKLYLLSISSEVDRALLDSGFRSEFKIINSVTEAI